ncbi:MAG TPA: lipopolysaccharide biosynthesis protein [Gammaproteobacteria bacterium]|nr:lipopolysaccharide biosynthesis protein [Gammaproteobacteria bacterium]
MEGLALRTWSSMRSRLRRAPFWRAVGVVAGGAAFAQTLSVLASPLLTRLYSPADYGTFALYLSVQWLLLVVATARYELAIPLPNDDRDAAKLLVFSLGLALAVSALLVAALPFGAARLLNGTAAAPLGPYLWFVPIALFFTAAYQCVTYWGMRQRAFETVAKTRMVQGFGRTAAQLALGLLGAGPLGLMLGDAIGRGGGSGTLVHAALRAHSAAFRSLRFSGIARAARAYRRFALITSGSALLEAGATQLPAVFLTMAFTIEAAGWYSLAQQVILMPVGLIANSVAQVYSSEAPRALREGPTQLRRVFLKSARGLALVALLPTIALAVAAPFAFSLVFGERWAEAGEFARVLAPMFFGLFVMWPLTYTLNVLGELNVLIAWSTLRFAAVLAVLAGVPALGGTPRDVVLAYSGVMSAALAALFVVCLWRIGRAKPAARARSERGAHSGE